MTINDDWEEFQRWQERVGHDEMPGWMNALEEFLGYADGVAVWVELF